MRKLTLVLGMMIATTAAAQQIDLKSLDKFAEKATSKTEMNMDEAMVKQASGFLDEGKNDEALAKKSAESLKGFYLRAYEFDQPGAFRLEDLKPILDQLKEPNWKPFLRAKEDDEQTEIWMHNTNGQPDGMLLVAAEDNEVVVINAIGLTNLQDLSRIGDEFSKLPLGDVKAPPTAAPPAAK
jgi:hypothetical protein